jgi:hypothetical protein
MHVQKAFVMISRTCFVVVVLAPMFVVAGCSKPPQANPTPETPTPAAPTPPPAELIVGKWGGKFPTEMNSGEVEVLDETWEFEKAGTYRRVLTVNAGSLTQRGRYRVLDEKSLELVNDGGGAKVVWKMTLTPDTLVIAHPTKPEPGALVEVAGTSTLRRAK